MKRLWMCVVISVFVCGLSACVQSGYSQENAELDVLIKGCNVTASLVHGAKGKVTVLRSSTGRISYQTTSEYTVTYDGSRYNVVQEMVYDKVEPSSELTPEECKTLIVPGTKTRRVFMCDGQKVSVLYTDHNTATSADLGSRFGQSVNTQVLDEVSMIDHGLVRLDRSVKSPTTLDRMLVTRHETIDGDDCVVVEKADISRLSGGNTTKLTQVFWITPAKGYTVPNPHYSRVA